MARKPTKPPARDPDAPKHPGGRPLKLTPALMDRIEQTVEELGFLAVSARVCGISARTMTYWRERGDHEGKDTTEEDPTGMFAEFRWRVDMAQAKYEKKLLTSGIDPRWLLERLKPKEYGEQKTLHLDGELVVEERVRKMSAAELAAEIARVESGNAG